MANSRSTPRIRCFAYCFGYGDTTTDRGYPQQPMTEGTVSEVLIRPQLRTPGEKGNEKRRSSVAAKDALRACDRDDEALKQQFRFPHSVWSSYLVSSVSCSSSSDFGAIH